MINSIGEDNKIRKRNIFIGKIDTKQKESVIVS